MGLTMQPCGKQWHFATQFFFSYFFDYVYALNVKHKPYFSALDGMPMVSAIFHAKEDLGSKHVLWSKTFVHNIGEE